MKNDYLESVKNQFEYYKQLGEKTFLQLKEEELFWKYNEESNSIANIVKHLWGNMLSRWMDIFTTDGEKEWRKRDEEFDNDILNKVELLNKWNDGWKCLFNVLDNLNANDLDKLIFIRNQGHSVTEAINRQLAHYPYHIGQIVFIGKLIRDDKWNSLSIPKGNSKKYNEEKFKNPKEKVHFTKEYLMKEESIMDKQEIIDLLKENHHSFINFISKLSSEEYVNSENQKWTAGHQLEHIVLCIMPLVQVFTMSNTAIEKTFGRTDGQSRTYDELLNAYLIKLNEGGKAPIRFIPEAIIPNQRVISSKSLTNLISELCSKVETFSEQELDGLLIPHPLLGNLTLREMLYNAIYHVKHHQSQIEHQQSIKHRRLIV